MFFGPLAMTSDCPPPLWRSPASPQRGPLHLQVPPGRPCMATRHGGAPDGPGGQALQEREGITPRITSPSDGVESSVWPPMVNSTLHPIPHGGVIPGVMPSLWWSRVEPWSNKRAVLLQVWAGSNRFLEPSWDALGVLFGAFGSLWGFSWFLFS